MLPPITEELLLRAQGALESGTASVPGLAALGSPGLALSLPEALLPSSIPRPLPYQVQRRPLQHVHKPL